jgi:hypothetical protein
VGWKRATERYGRLWGVGLSENQCGMETKQKRMTFRRYVEREPMWDGNRQRKDTVGFGELG